MQNQPFSYPKGKPARAEASAQLTNQTLFEWPPLKGKKPLLWSISVEAFLKSTESAIPGILEASSAPLDPAEIGRAIGYPENAGTAPLSEYLAQAALRGDCHAWPSKKKGKLAFWSKSIQTVTSELALKYAGESITSRKQLLARLKNSGTSSADADRLTAKLESEGKLVDLLVPAEKKTAAVLNPKHPGVFLGPVSRLLSILLRSGVDRERLRAALAALLPPDADHRILTLLKSAEPQAGAHYSVTKLRHNDSLSDLSKQDFDAACLRLWKNGDVDLHYHDAPHNMSETNLNYLVRDGNETYYIGISRRARP